MLNQSQIHQFREQGFFTIEPLLSPAEVAEACEAISHVIRHRLVDLDIEPKLKDKAAAMSDVEMAVRKLMWFTKVEPRLKVLSEHPVLVGVIEELLGEKCKMIQDMALLKPPHFGVEKPWHQDNAYFRVSPPEKVIGSWIALDEATAENGCMRVIPGTHKQGPVAHHHIRDCQIPDDRVAVEQQICVPLKPGGVLIFAGLLHHGTPNNTSATRRRALQFHYAADSAQTISPEEHGAIYNEDRKYAGCAVWPRSEAEKMVVNS